MNLIWKDDAQYYFIGSSRFKPWQAFNMQVAKVSQMPSLLEIAEPTKQIFWTLKKAKRNQASSSNFYLSCRDQQLTYLIKRIFVDMS